MKKITEQRGASILMALLLVLLASVVSAVILTAAVSAAKQLRTDRQAQQNYLTVSSAAELVRESIRADRYEQEVVTVVTEGKRGESPKTTSETKETLPSGLLGPWLARGIKSGGYCAETTLFLQLEGSEKLEKVKLAFSMSSYKVTVVLSLADASGATDDCRMTLTLDGMSNTSVSTVSGEGGVSQTTTTTTVNWPNASITKGG